MPLVFWCRGIKRNCWFKTFFPVLKTLWVTIIFFFSQTVSKTFSFSHGNIDLFGNWSNIPSSLRHFQSTPSWTVRVVLMYFSVGFTFVFMVNRLEGQQWLVLWEISWKLNWGKKCWNLSYLKIHFCLNLYHTEKSQTIDIKGIHKGQIKTFFKWCYFF